MTLLSYAITITVGTGWCTEANPHINIHVFVGHNDRLCYRQSLFTYYYMMLLTKSIQIDRATVCQKRLIIINLHIPFHL